MRVAEAEARLRQMLADAGVDLESAEKPTAVQKVWEIYQRFAAEPVDEAVDDPDADMPRSPCSP